MASNSVKCQRVVNSRLGKGPGTPGPLCSGLIGLHKNIHLRLFGLIDAVPLATLVLGVVYELFIVLSKLLGNRRGDRVFGMKGNIDDEFGGGLAVILRNWKFMELGNFV